jgi:hypothetical protein
MRTRMATLNAQLDTAWRCRQQTKPRSKRRVKLDDAMVNIQLKRLKMELRRTGK